MLEILNLQGYSTKRRTNRKWSLPFREGRDECEFYMDFCVEIFPQKVKGKFLNFKDMFTK